MNLICGLEFSGENCGTTSEAFPVQNATDLKEKDASKLLIKSKNLFTEKFSESSLSKDALILKF